MPTDYVVRLLLAAALLWPVLVAAEGVILLAAMVTTDYFPQKQPGKGTRFFLYLIGAPLAFVTRKYSVFMFVGKQRPSREKYLGLILTLLNVFVHAVLLAVVLGAPGLPLLEALYGFLLKLFGLWLAISGVLFILKVVWRLLRQGSLASRLRIYVELFVDASLGAITWTLFLGLVYAAAKIFNPSFGW